MATSNTLTSLVAIATPVLIVRRGPAILASPDSNTGGETSKPQFFDSALPSELE